jgi:hypothetical protein
MLAAYNPAGKIQTVYRFRNDFSLQRYTEFSYEGNSTHIKIFTSDARLLSETLSENDGVFVITHGEKRKVNNTSREQHIRDLVKFGLKPLYPGY